MWDVPNTADPFARAAAVPRRSDEALVAYEVGANIVVPLVQFHYRADPARFFPDGADWPTDPSGWYCQEPYMVDGLLAIDMGGFLIRTPDRVLLIDTGIGNAKTRPNPHLSDRKDDWLGLLDQLGIGVDDVDTVLFTHLHVDHVGFATTWDGNEWRPTFPRARYHVVAEELDYWTSTDAYRELGRLGNYIDDSVLPLDRAGLLVRASATDEIAEGISLRPASGHTPGNVCIGVSSRGENALFVGDMVHHALQLAFPGLSTDFCVDYEGAAAARQRMLSSLGSDDLLFTAHFPDSAPGRIRAGEDGGYLFDRVSPSFTLDGRRLM